MAMEINRDEAGPNTSNIVGSKDIINTREETGSAVVIPLLAALLALRLT